MMARRRFVSSLAVSVLWENINPQTQMSTSDYCFDPFLSYRMDVSRRICGWSFSNGFPGSSRFPGSPGSMKRDETCRS
jgi:hypothetical protein